MAEVSGLDSFLLYNGADAPVSMQLSGSAISRALESKTAYVDNRLGKFNPYYDMRKFWEAGYRSLLIYPLSLGANTAGALLLSSKKEGVFDSSWATRAQVIGAVVYQAMQYNQLSKRLKTREMVSRLLYDFTGKSVLILDPYGRVVEANASAMEVLGRTSFMGERAVTFFEDDGEAAALLSLSEKKEARGFLTLKITGVEKLVYARASSTIFGGERVYALSFSQASNDSFSGKIFQEAVDQAPEIVFRMDSNGVVDYANQAAKNFFKKSDTEMRGMQFSEFVSPSDHLALAKSFSMLKEDSKSLNGLETRFLREGAKAKPFELSASVVPDARGKPTVWIYARDSETRMISKAPEQMLSHLVEHASDAVYSFDKYGVIRSWNKAAQSVFGYSKDEVLGTDIRRLYPEEKQEELEAILYELSSKGAFAGLETKRKKKSGDLVSVIVSAKAVRDEANKITGYIEVIRDISLLKKYKDLEAMHARLEKRAKELQEMSEAQSVFVSNVSHELRTPLTNIHGYTQLVSEGDLGPLNSEQTDSMRIVLNETERLTRLINDVLDLSKMDSGRFRINPKEFDLRDLLEKCSCKSMADKKSLYVEWNLENNLPAIYGDQARIAQVFINLISNAIKFTESGGVTVNIKRKSREFVLAEVIDTGCGIPEAEKKNLFKRFYQVQPKAGQKQQGTGLGLAIVKEIVQLHGGKIWFESETAKGSKFSFTLRIRPRKSRVKTSNATDKEQETLKSPQPRAEENDSTRGEVQTTLEPEADAGNAQNSPKG